MNIAEIETALRELVGQPFDRDGFVFDFLSIYDAPKSTITKGVVELIDAKPKRPQFRSVFRFLPTPAYRSWSSCLVRTH